MKIIATLAAAAFAATAFGMSAPADAAGARGSHAETFEVAGPHRCVAVAKRRGGYGAPIPGTRNVAYGRGACVRAAAACRHDLRKRKRHGLNPYAACVVVRHHRRHG